MKKVFLYGLAFSAWCRKKYMQLNPVKDLLSFSKEYRKSEPFISLAGGSTFTI